MTTSARSGTAGPRLSARAIRVGVDEVLLRVDLEDGRLIAVPVVWFPRLAEATDEQRRNWRLVGRGVGIHWPDLDEDISVENLLGADGELLMDRGPSAREAADRQPRDRGRPRAGARRQSPLHPSAGVARPGGEVQSAMGQATSDPAFREIVEEVDVPDDDEHPLFRRIRPEG